MSAKNSNLESMEQLVNKLKKLKIVKIRSSLQSIEEVSSLKVLKLFQYIKNADAITQVDPAAVNLDLEATQIILGISQNGNHVTAMFLDPNPDAVGEEMCIWTQQLNCGGHVITDVAEVHHWLLMVT